MLVEIYKEALLIMAERAGSSAVYCGWGTPLDEMISSFYDAGGSWKLISKGLALAYYK